MGYGYYTDPVLTAKLLIFYYFRVKLLYIRYVFNIIIGNFRDKFKASWDFGLAAVVHFLPIFQFYYYFLKFLTTKFHRAVF